MICIYCSAISALLKPHCLHKASNHPIISKLMHHFCLQHPPKNVLILGLLNICSLFEIWAPDSTLTTFQLAWKTATLLALVIPKYCSGLTLLCIDNQHLFQQHHAAIFFPISGGKLIDQAIFLLRFTLSLIPMLIFALFFYLKAYLRCTESFRKKPNGLHVTSLVLSSNRQHRPVFAKTISSSVRKVVMCS